MTLEERIKELEEKLEMAKKDIKRIGKNGGFSCLACKHYNHGEGTNKCMGCPRDDNYVWRGE